MKHFVLLGAGKAGRGFLARLFATHAQITFIDRDPALVRALQAQKSYPVRYASARPADTISGYRALHTEDPACREALRQSDAVFTCVRGENCPDAAAWLADKLPPQTPLLACENAVAPAGLLGPLAPRACSAAVFCTTMAVPGSLDIESEDYPALHIDAKRAPDWLCRFPGIAAEVDFPLLMLRKIYTYNASSAIIAYLGAQKGIENYAEAATEPEIAHLLTRFYQEIDRAICLEYGVEPAVQQAFSRAARAKFENPAIRDSVERNAASPLRKLQSGERLIAPARLLEKHGGDASPLYRAAAAALHYLHPASPEAARDALLSASGLSAEDPIVAHILSYY